MSRRSVLSAAALLSLCRPAAAQGASLVFAAASLKTVLDEIAGLPEAPAVRLSYGGSGQLARQILQGAPAELYISAHPEWMDQLQKAGALQDGSRCDLVSNRLVLIGRQGAAPVLLRNNFPTGRRVVTGLIDAVPAGRYAKQALEHYHLWEAVSGNLVQMENVRVALAMVARGDLRYGIVYETDALAEPRVQILARFSPESHEPIVYPLALTTGAAAPAAQFRAFLKTDPAREVFSAQGFGLI